MGVGDLLRGLCFCSNSGGSESSIALNTVPDVQKPVATPLTAADPGEELLRLQQDLSALGKSTWFQRVSLLLEAVSYHACGIASIFGVVYEEPVKDFILVASSLKQEQTLLTGSAPSLEQAAVLQTMLSTQRPVSESVQSARAKAADPAATAASAVICAVPLFEGGAVVGALLLQVQAPDSTALSPSLSPADKPGAQFKSRTLLCHSSPLLSLQGPAMLKQLALAAAVGLGADAAQLRWMAAVLHRVSTANSMHALVWGLCEDLRALVRQHFIVHLNVRAVLLPRADAPVGLLFHAQPGNPSPHNGHSNITHSLYQSPGRNRNVDLQLSSGGGLRNIRSSGYPFGGHAALTTAGLVPNNGVAGGMACNKLGTSGPSPIAGPRQRMRVLAGSLTGSDSDAAPAPRRLGPCTLGGEAIRSARVLALTADTIALSRPLDPAAVTFSALPNGPTSAGSNVAPQLSRTVVVQLPAHMTNDASTPSLHAQAFPLKHTMLQALAAAGPEDAPFRGMSIDDVASYLQNVHNPSRDVCLLMTTSRTGTAAPTAATITANGPFPGSPRTGPVLPATSTSPLHASFGGGAAGAGGGGSGGMTTAMAAGSSVISGAGGTHSVLQSLVLVGAQLGESVLAFYLCFSKRLPAELLEAVRDSCNELLEQMLLGPLRAKVASSLAPEFETLRSTTPGNFAVLRSPSLNGLLRRPSSHGAVVARPPLRSAGTLRGACGAVQRRMLGACGEGAGVGTAAAATAGTLPACAGHGGGAGSARECCRESMELCCSSSGELSPFTAGNATPKGASLPRNVSFHVDCGARAGTASATATGTAMRTGTSMGGSFVRRPPFCDVQALGLGNEELMSAFLRQSETAGSQGEPHSASIMTVTEVDPMICVRQQLDLLVTSIHTTMTTETNGAMLAYADDLEQLELTDVLGKGGGGVVYRGRLGTQDVAVKVMELPDVDVGETQPAASTTNTPKAPDGSCQKPGGSGGNGGDADGPVGLLKGPSAGLVLAKEQLRARRALLRNAMEMAVQGRVSHPNLIQVYGIYTNVMVERRRRPDGSRCHCLMPSDSAVQEFGMNPPSPVCCAIIAEMADGGTLASALTVRIFPRVMMAPRGARLSQPDQHGFHIDMRGVYMTLLDVALALRHLHSLNLVHRDIKPANLLLKLNPRDYRGFTVKLADFGFVLHLTETDEDGSRYVMVDQACGTVTHMAPELLPGKARVETSADVYSFGILMWECVAGGSRPFPHLHPDAIPRHVFKGARPVFGESVPLSFRALAQACWSADPQRRPKAAELVAHMTGALSELE